MGQILLVEGKDDLFVFSNIFDKNNVEQTFKIIDKNGIEEIFKSIPIYTKTDLSTIGIIIDADSNIVSRWNKLKLILSKSGYTLPAKISNVGTILIDANLPKIGIWIMPNNIEDGMLEDFVHHLIPRNDRLIQFVDKTLSILEEKGLQNYSLIHQSKAKIHTWLAWQKNPGTPMGLAINKKYLNSDSVECKAFLKWINNLYN